MLKQACMNTPVIAFANYTKEFLLETDTSKEHLGAVLSQKQEDGWFHPVAYGSCVLTIHEKNYSIMAHFREYLLYQPFMVKMDNNPLTYIMSTPNLDATGHHWVNALAKYDFWLEYQKGQDNIAADALSHIVNCLPPEAVQAVLDGAAVGTPQWAEVENPAVVENSQCLE